jgi:aerobic carbon-monoxide dehydrogenase medium subunit
MIPQSFDYSAPATLKEALALIENSDAKLLAGGMSLIPLMKLRLAQPERVIDLARIPGMNGIELSGETIRIGAMATHHELEVSPAIRAHCPLLGETASQIGDPQVRNRGTIGGSVAHADPAADYPAALLALEANFRLASAKRERTVSAADFFRDAFTTALDADEIVVEVQVPVEDSHEGYAYEKLAHPASGFAVVGVAARVRKSGDKIAMARIGVTGLGSNAFRAQNAENLLERGAGAAAAAAVVGEGIDANSDLYATAGYRLHLARVYAKRAIAAALVRTS